MKKRGEKNIFIGGSLYSLLLYLLVAKSDDIEQTFFFFSNSMPNEVCQHFNKSYKLRCFKNKILKDIYFLFIKWLKYIRWPFLRTAKFYGADNIDLTFLLLGRKKITVIEDGVNTYKYEGEKVRINLLGRIIFGHMVEKRHFGQHEQAEEIILTGILPYTNPAKTPVRIIDIVNLWNSSSLSKQNLIRSVFNISDDDVAFISGRSSIVFTQPLSEDGIISEQEKIALYKKLIADADLNELVFRPHPREKTNYTLYFPNVLIFDKQIPFELMSLLGGEFKKVYTIFSTAVYSLPKDTLIVYGGTQMHPDLARTFGIVKWDGE